MTKLAATSRSDWKFLRKPGQTLAVLKFWASLSCWMLTHILPAAPGLTQAALLSPEADASTASSAPLVNYGRRTGLVISHVPGRTNKAYLKFAQTNFSALAATQVSDGVNRRGAEIEKATLKLWVVALPHAGGIAIERVLSAWAEKEITASNAPAATRL